MRRIIQLNLFVTIAILLFSMPAFCQKGAVRRVYNMNPNWEFAIENNASDDRSQFSLTDQTNLKWKGVHLPHTPKVEPKEFGLHWQGVCWYKKQFAAEPKWEGKRVSIKFEAVMQQADVWLNGKKVAQHMGGYLPFTLDITELIDYSKNSVNTIVVRADNRDNAEIPPGRMLSGLDMTYQGGIYRDVNLTVSDKLHVSDAVDANKQASGGIFVTYPLVSSNLATVNVKTHLVNQYNVSQKCVVVQQLIASDGKMVAESSTQPSTILAGADMEFITKFSVKNPKLWHPNSPSRYTLRTIVKQGKKSIDQVETLIGIRSYSWKVDGFYINGEKMLLYGANRHQDGIFVGNALSANAQRLDAKKLREAGFNNVRAGHYPLDPVFMDACDEYGLTVIACIPGWHWYKNSDLFKQRSYQNLRDLVRRDRNHPSVILYETILNETRYSDEYARTTYNICKEEDPTSYAACDFKYPEYELYDVNYKVPDDSKPSFTREWGDDNRFCGIYKNKKGSTWGDWANRVDEHSMVYQSLARQKDLNGDGYWDWYHVNANPNMAGYALWVGFDHNRGATNNIARCGVWGLDRYPKFCHYFLQSQRDPSVLLQGLNSGPMVFIGTYWQQTSLSDVNVYSNCEKVQLFLNDQLIGEQIPDDTYDEGNGVKPMHHVDHPIFTFKNMKWQQGTLVAKGLIDGKVVATHSVRSPQKAVNTTIEMDHIANHLKADGSDMAMIFIKATDSNGTIDPNFNGEVEVTINGQGQLIGANPVMIEGGVGAIWLRSTTKSGKIALSTQSKTLNNGNLTVVTKKSRQQFVGGPFTAQIEPIRNIENHFGNIKVSEKRKAIKGIKVTTSSNKEGYSKSALTDSDNESWWFAKENTNQWIVMELKEATSLSGSLIVWEKDSNWYQFQIKVSKDGNRWTKVYEDSQTGHNFETEDWKADGVKWVKIELLNINPTDGLMGIREINLYK